MYDISKYSFSAAKHLFSARVVNAIGRVKLQDIKLISCLAVIHLKRDTGIAILPIHV